MYSAQGSLVCSTAPTEEVSGSATAIAIATEKFKESEGPTRQNPGSFPTHFRMGLDFRGECDEQCTAACKKPCGPGTVGPVVTGWHCFC